MSKHDYTLDACPVYSKIRRVNGLLKYVLNRLLERPIEPMGRAVYSTKYRVYGSGPSAGQIIRIWAGTSPHKLRWRYPHTLEFDSSFSLDVDRYLNYGTLETGTLPIIENIFTVLSGLPKKGIFYN